MTSSSRSGRKTLTSGRDVEPGQAVDRRAVHAQVLRLARLEAHLEPVLAVVALGRSSATRATVAPRRTSSRSFDGARRARRAAEVERLEQVGLAGAVRARRSTVRPVAELDLRTLVVAEVAQLDARRRAPARLHVQADRHDEVAEAGAVVPGLDQARAAAG